MAAAKLDEADIFHVARQIEAGEARRLYLEQSCGGDRDLQARLGALLRVHDEDRSFLEKPAEGVAAARAEPITEGPGTQIGHYQLVEQIGEGGFGKIFLAQQQKPVRRLVALKIVKPGMDTTQVVARFEAERQALALMDHPNIARVLDGGETGSGRPYFVMELVKGVPITQFCDEHHLTPRQRLSLFTAVCRAIAHAHQKGIIHRDLKPSNVLVADDDGKPSPKVIDFGVAKALEQRLTERTLITGVGGIVGTLEYMSPEQAEFNARDVDTRADIYSLGILLYELLTGTTPLTHKRMTGTAMTEALRLIREEEPPRPSTRLSEAKDAPASITPQRKLEPAILSKEVRGELDWIVMKALEKDRDRRYATADGLARDIERYLNDEPVEACPPTVVYMLRKFARKNRKVLGVVTAFALLLTAATAVSLLLAVRATQAEQAASQERDRAEAEAKRARRHVYAANMNLGQSAWEEARVERLVKLLKLHQPDPANEDLRGFEWYYWARLTDTALLSLRGHSGLIVTVVFSPDGKQLASASEDSTVRVWDATTGQETLTLEGHAGMVASVAFSPDGRSLASASTDKTVKIWDLASGRAIQTLRGHSNWVACVAFSPDGKRLASASHDRTVKVWDLGTGRNTLTLKGHESLLMCVAFSPDGQWLVSSSKDNTVRLWDAASGQEIRTLRGHTDEVRWVTFSPDGKQLASASYDQTVKVWDVASGREKLTLKGHRERVFGVAFSPDGKQLASASFDQTVKVWDAASGRETLTLKGHTSWVSCVVFSPDGKRLASTGFDQTIKVWSATAGQVTMTVMKENDWLLSAAFSPDGRRLASAADDKIITVWDPASGREAIFLRGHTDSVRSIAFRPDGKSLASASADKTVKVWDLASGRNTLTLRGGGPLMTVAFSPDGNRLAAAGEDKTVRVWDMDSGSETLILKGHKGAIRGVAFSSDGKRLASASEDQTAKVWDLASGRTTWTLKAHTGFVSSVAFSPDGTRLASAGADQTARIWDVATGQEVLTLDGHASWVSSVAFSPDGKRLASASRDTTVKVWDTVSGQETLTLKGHTALVSSVVFSPDGKRLASAAHDGTLRVWDTRPWTPQLRLEQEARALLGHLYASFGLKADVIRRIKQDATLAADVKHMALEMANRWEEAPDRLDSNSWEVVARVNAPPEDYAKALRQAEVACRLEAGNGKYLNTLGVALYRSGKFQESLDALMRSDRLNSVSSVGRYPPDIAFIAMSQFMLGQQDKAQASLTDLRHLLKQPAWIDNTEAQIFLGEATNLIDAKR